MQFFSKLPYMGITKLTPKLLRLFIEKIVVHKKVVKRSKHAPQTAALYYNSIGCIENLSKKRIGKTICI